MRLQRGNEPVAVIENLLPAGIGVGEQVAWVPGKPLHALGHRATLLPLCAQQGKKSGTVSERMQRSEEHTSELQSQSNLVCRLLLEKKKTTQMHIQIDTQSHNFVTVVDPIICILHHVQCSTDRSIYGRAS